LVQQTSEKSWEAEARTEETKQLIRDTKRVTRRKFTAEEKIRIAPWAIGLQRPRPSSLR